MVDQEEIHNQCLSEDPKKRIHASEQLRISFSSMPDKQQAWNDLHRLTNDEFSDVRCIVTSAFRFSFSDMPDKQQAWNDLHRLTNDQEWYVRRNATYALVSAFSQLPDKQQVWNDLHRLTNCPDSDVRSSAAKVLGSVFSQLPDKQQAWNDLHRLTNDKDGSVRYRAAYAFVSAFSQVPDKQQAWNDLLKLTNDENYKVKSSALEALDSAFSQLPDKQQAWNDLLKLTNDEDYKVKSSALEALGSAFSQVPDKQQAWNDLHRLINDENSRVRSQTASALGSVFSQVPDKQQAWNDLLRMTNDKLSSVSTSSNHSLGRISIFKASQAETDEDYKKEFEKAIEFFETAAQESYKWNNPVRFCLPFYRSFHTIVFKKQEAKEEVNKYLEEAKDAIEGSESKKQLFEAVQNLAEALKEVQNLEKLDLEAKKGELNFYRKYCDHAAELMKCTDEKAPFATEVLRKGLPILDRNLKELLEEIQKKAKIACKESKGTATEAIVCEINKEIQNAINDDQKQYIEILENILSILKIKLPSIPENKFILSKIQAVDNKVISPEKYQDLPLIISIMPTMKVVSEQELDQKLDEKLQKFDRIFDEIICVKDKLNCISFDISKIKLNSADVISDLETMKEELEKLSKIEGLNTLSIEKLDSFQAEKINGFNNNILGRLDEIQILIHELSKDNNEIYEEYSWRLDELKQSKLDTLLQRYSAVISLIGFVISGISIAH